MNPGLYPIVRRVRRPLVVVDTPPVVTGDAESVAVNGAEGGTRPSEIGEAISRAKEGGTQGLNAKTPRRGDASHEDGGMGTSNIEGEQQVRALTSAATKGNEVRALTSAATGSVSESRETKDAGRKTKRQAR